VRGIAYHGGFPMTEEQKTDHAEELPVEDLDVAPEDAEQVKGGDVNKSLLLKATAGGTHINKVSLP
jgi:hypothetical protein